MRWGWLLAADVAVVLVALALVVAGFALRSWAVAAIGVVVFLFGSFELRRASRRR